MFAFMEKIEKAVGEKGRCTLVEKSGRHLHGTMTDHWVHYSAGKLRGKVVFLSDEKGEVQVDANDILDVRFEAR